MFKSKKGHGDVVLCVLLKGKLLATGSLDATVKLWDVETLALRHTLKGHEDGVVVLATNSTLVDLI